MNLGTIGKIVALFVVLAFGQQAVAQRPITVVGRAESVITTNAIRFGDIAHVTAQESNFDEAVIGLQKLTLGASPAPGQEVQLSAEEVIKKLRSAGVNLKDVTYTLPKTMRVERAGRLITLDEVRVTIERLVAAEARDQAVRMIRYAEDKYAPPGTIQVSAVLQQQREQGRRVYLIAVTAGNEITNQFPVDVVVDEWIQVPTARRPIGKGEVVSESDVAMARLSLQQLPKDAAVDGESIIGLALKSDVGYGEIFRRDKLAIPPVILQGSSVTLRYARGLFEASASGIALESGIRGAEIRVRNENSKRVVKGVVREPGLVEVSP